MQAPNRLYKSEVRASACKRVKTPCEQGLPHRTYVLQAEQRLPSATEKKAKRSFPMEIVFDSDTTDDVVDARGCQPRFAPLFVSS